MMTNDERKEVEERTRLELITGNDTFRQTIIQKEVDAALQRWATGIGITSFVALGALLIGIFTTINSVTASTVKDQIVQNTKLLDGPIQTVMNSSMTQVIKMQQAMKDMEDKVARANADLEKTQRAAADAQRRAMQDMEGQVAQAKAAAMKAQQTAADAQRRADNVSTAAKRAAGITEADWTKIRLFLDYLKEHKREADIEMTVAGLDHKMASLDDKVPALEHKMAALDDKVSQDPKYEILERTYNRSNLGALSVVDREELVDTIQFSRPIVPEHVWVAISGVNTQNSATRPVNVYWFKGRAEVDAMDHQKVKVFVGHHMSDMVDGSGSDGYIRVLVIGLVESQVK